MSAFPACRSSPGQLQSATLSLLHQLALRPSYSPLQTFALRHAGLHQRRSTGGVVALQALQQLGRSRGGVLRSGRGQQGRHLAQFWALVLNRANVQKALSAALSDPKWAEWWRK